MIANNFKEVGHNNIWTLKESIVKAFGEGLNISLDKLSINFNQDHIEVIQDYYKGSLYLKNYLFIPNYSLSVCSIDKDFFSEVKIIDYKLILKNFNSFV